MLFADVGDAGQVVDRAGVRRAGRGDHREDVVTTVGIERRRQGRARQPTPLVGGDRQDVNVHHARRGLNARMRGSACGEAPSRRAAAAARPGRVTRGDQGREVAGGAAGDEHATGRGGHARQVRDPSQGLVLGPHRARPLQPAAAVDRGRADREVEQHARLGRSARHEREVGGVVGRDRGGREHLRPHAERLLAADPAGGDRRPGPLGQLLSGGGAVQGNGLRDAVARVRDDRRRQRLGVSDRTRARGPRYFTSSWQNSPNASTYVRMSSSVCCTEIVHCSSSPGVMKMPRLIIHGYEAQ